MTDSTTNVYKSGSCSYYDTANSDFDWNKYYIAQIEKGMIDTTGDLEMDALEKAFDHPIIKILDKLHEKTILKFLDWITHIIEKKYRRKMEREQKT